PGDPGADRAGLRLCALRVGRDHLGRLLQLAGPGAGVLLPVGPPALPAQRDRNPSAGAGMTILAGLGPADDHSTIEFAATLARSDGQDLWVVSVVPAPWPTLVSGGVDKEYAAWAAEQGRAAAARAREYIAE